MTREEGVEVVHVVEPGLSPGWQWRPQVVEDGEALRLLQRYAEERLPESARQEVLGAALDVLARCASPSIETGGQETGLVVGYVQSGKTLSFTAVAALACDNKFPLIVVLLGTKTNLYGQNVKRLRRDLKLEDPAGRWSLFEAQTRNPDLPQHINHLLEQWDEPELPGVLRRTVLITVLKNRQRIDGLVQALQQIDLRDRPCLIIDDEADQYGLNTKVRQEDGVAPYSPVYGALLSLRAALPRHTYLQYTATPQALLLISVLDSLSPQFGLTLAAGVGYCGGKSFFGERAATELVRPIPEHELPVADGEVPTGPPDSLLIALRLFYVGVAIQAVHRGQDESTQLYRSMLIHPSMRQMDHLQYKYWVESVRDSWIEILGLDASDLDRRELVDDFRSAYEDLQSTVNNCRKRNPDHERVPPFEDVFEYLRSAMRYTRIWEVNSRLLKQWSQENWQDATSHILVGGENLGRGFTVEGLTTTYMPRGRGSGVADTIQQRGRFFGYKENYLGLCRVFLPSDVWRDYENYIEHESYVMQQLAQLSQSGESMLEWRRRMLLAQSLRPTRRSVMPDIYKHLKVREWTQQSQPWTRDADIEVERNWQVIDSFLGRYEFVEAAGSDRRNVEQRNAVAEGVRLDDVLHRLLVPMWFSSRDRPNVSAVELAIQWHLRSNPDAVAVVYRMAAGRPPDFTGQRRERSIEHGHIDNLHQGADPGDGDSRGPRGSIYPGDRHIHAINSVTVQIHDLDLLPRPRSRQILRSHVPAIAVRMPRFMRVGVFEEMAT